MTLSECCRLKAGKTVHSREIKGKRSNSYPYACWGGNGVRGYVQEYSHEGAYPIIGRQGALCGNVNYATEKFWATEHAVVVSSTFMHHRYLYHMLSKMNLNQYASKGAQPGLSVAGLSKLKVVVAPQDEQRKIAGVLDELETLVNDISNGLPAEIAARQKQYEYYRDKLLSFKPLKKHE